MKDLAKDIYYEVSQPSREKVKKAVASTSKAAAGSLASDSMIAQAAAKESNRQFKLGALKKLLKIEVINSDTQRLLKSTAYQAYIAEKVMFKIVSSTTENVAASFNKIFLHTQFSRRFIAYLYWGDDNR